MDRASRYIVYVDESGDHGPISAEYPVFVLAFCIKRRRRVPEGVVLHYGDVAEGDRPWFGPVPATAPLRTLEECAAEHLPPDLLRGAALDALHRGLVAGERADRSAGSPAVHASLGSRVTPT